MPTFVSLINFTDQGFRNVKDSPHRIEAGKAMLRELGGEVKDVYMTVGQYDAVMIAEVPQGEIMTKFVLALGSLGNVRTETVRAFTEEEFQGIVADLP